MKLNRKKNRVIASRNNDLVRKLSKLYNAYTAIDDDRALRRSGMTLAEYNALPDVFTRLQNDGRAETFMSGLANYFQKFGFNVSEGNGVNFVITASSSIGRRRITASTSDMKFQRFIDEVADTATVDLGLKCQIRNDRGSDDYATWGAVTFVFRPDWDNRWVSVHVYFDFADNDYIDNPISCTVRDSWDGHDEDETFSTFSECEEYIINTIEHRLVDF